MPDVFDELEAEPKGDVFDEIAPEEDSGPDQIRIPTRTERIKATLQGLAPNLFSTQRSSITDKPLGLIPALHEGFQTSPLDAVPNIPEIPKKEGDDSIEGKIEKLPLDVAAGVGDFALGTARFLTSPYGSLIGAAGSLGPLARRIIAAPFAPILVKQGAEKLGETSVTGDPRAATEGALLLGAGGAAGAHASGIKLPEKVSKADLRALDESAAKEKSLREEIYKEPNTELSKSELESLPQAAPEPVKPAEPVKDVFDEVAPEPVVESKITEPVIEKGVENAPEARPIEEGVPIERQGIDQSGPPTEAGGGNRVPSPANEQAAGEVTAPGGIGSVYESTHRGKPVWMVQESAKRGFGDSIWDTAEEANKSARITRMNEQSRAESRERLAKEAKDLEALKQEKADFNGFEEGKTPMQIGKLVSTLSEGQFNYKGRPITRRDLIRQLVDEGRTVQVIDGERVLASSEGTFMGQKTLTKLGLDYAEHLVELKNNPTVDPAIKEMGAEKTPIELINTSPKVKVKAPEGASTIRATDSKGRTATQPTGAFKSANPLQGADIVKIEAGTIDKSGKFKPIEGPISVGPGAESVGELPKAELAQLTDTITQLAEASKNTEPSKAFDLGEAMSTLKDNTSKAISGLKAAGQYLIKKQEGKPIWTSFKEALGDRHLELSESAHNARKFVEKATKDVPDKELQDAISNWIDAGGDQVKLREFANSAKPKYKAGYERALKLTPEQKTFAENIKNYFESRLDDAQKAGILKAGIEDYIHRIYESDSKWKNSVLAELDSGLNTQKPGLAKKRVFEYDAEAEAAGLSPIKSFIKRVAAYDLSLNKAIADRKAVKAMMEIKMPDGRPMIDVAGLGTKTIPDTEGGQATLINPKWKPSDPETPAKYRGDYKSVDAAALRKWKWVSADENGNPTLVQGDVLIHPDALKQVKAVIGSSLIRKSKVGRAALNVGSTVKQTMLDMSLFHPVQIAVHGFEHRSFKPAPEIDFTDPKVRGLVKGGMVVGETSGRAAFDEGLAGSSLTKHIPGVGPYITQLKDWIFQSYIPRLKVSTGLHALERNRGKYPNLSKSELNHLTAEQMNHAFGELNYEMMGRSKTAQDALRLTLLAPDFLEARTKFVGDALTKYGNEQFVALGLGAIAFYTIARVLNKLVSGQYHFELENAFSVVHNGKAYGLRTVQGDVIHAVTDLQHFTRNRLNPAITRPAMEWVTGRDEFGRKRTLPQQVGDWAKTGIPISIKGLFQGREKTLMESLLNSTGLTVRRATADTSIRKKLSDWKEKNKIQSGPGEFVYDPDKDQYRNIRLAAQQGDVDGVREEVQKAIKAGVKYADIIKHFHLVSTRPISGSRKNDLLFTKTLSEDDKKTFEEAKRERQKIYSIIRQAGR